ncbi:unnamed protein product, partial [Chrysoparadoxa australica]
PSSLRWRSSHQLVKGQFSLTLPVDVGGALVSYRFNTHDYDISFGVEYRWTDTDGEQTVETVLPQQRVNSHEEPAAGDFTVQRGPGSLVLTWDNTYSWLHEKALVYQNRERGGCFDTIYFCPLTSSCHSFPSGKLEELAPPVRQRLKEKQEQRLATAARLASLESAKQALQVKIDAEAEALANLQRQEDAIRTREELLSAKILGAGIRALPTPALDMVLKFGSRGERERWQCVCRQWASAIGDLKT